MRHGSPHHRVALLHDPKCSKCRALKDALDELGVADLERRCLDEPLDRRELEDLVRRFARPARAIVRAKEAAHAEAGLDARSSDAQVLDALARHPVRIERPVLVKGERAAIGRPGREEALGILG